MRRIKRQPGTATAVVVVFDLIDIDIVMVFTHRVRDLLCVLVVYDQRHRRVA
jgi:hypothetical protein